MFPAYKWYTLQFWCPTLAGLGFLTVLAIMPDTGGHYRAITALIFSGMIWAYGWGQIDGRLEPQNGIQTPASRQAG